MIGGMDDLKKVLRSTTVEVIRVFEELEQKGLELSRIDYGDTISKKEIHIAQNEAVTQPTVKELPQPKTYNDANRSTHINMATNDLCAICGAATFGGNLDNNREWIRNVGQDLI